MSQKVKMQAINEAGEIVQEKMVDIADVQAKKAKAEGLGYTVEIVPEITEEERIAAYPPVSAGEAFRGGLLQGLSLGAEDEIFGKEDTRTQQEAEQQIPYTTGKAIGGIIPGAVAGTAGGLAGALAGGKIGGMIGAAGGPIGAAGGAAIGGLLGATGGGALASGVESYMSQPSDERSLSQAAGDAAISAALGLIPGAPIVSRGRKAVGSLLAPVKKKIAETAEELPKIKEIGKETWEKARELGKKTFSDDLLPGERTMINKSILEKVRKGQKLAKEEAEILSTVTTAEAAVLAAELGIPVGAVQSLVQGVISMESPEELSALNRQAAERAYEEAMRRKTEKLMSESEVAAAEKQARKTVEQQTASKLKKLRK